MRCENCPALKTDGYEYPQDYCACYPEDDLVDFADGTTGCRHPANAIKKKLAILNEFEGKRYEGITEFYQERQDVEIAVTDALLDAMMWEAVVLAFVNDDNSLSKANMESDSVPRSVAYELIRELESAGYKIVKKE